jgi:glycosyltransferase involved in cell wall biosynthesis
MSLKTFCCKLLNNAIQKSINQICIKLQQNSRVYMKVLWLCSWYPNSHDVFDGDFIERQAKALSAKQPVDVIHVVQNPMIGAGTKPTAEEYLSNGYRAEILFTPTVNTRFSILNNFFFNWRYQKLLVSSIQQYIQKNGKPDLVHVQVPVKAGYGALWLKKKFKTPFVVTEHYNIYHKEGSEKFSSFSSYFRYLTTRVFQFSKKVIAVSDYLGKSIQQVALNKPYSVIPNVVDTSLFFYKPLQNKDRIFRFLHVSNLAEIKNPRLMLEAISLFCKTGLQADFVFIGNKNDLFIKEAAAMGIPGERIRFMGELPYAEVAAQMQQADAFFLFSKSETFSCATAEALCCGLPVIAPLAGALPELINETNGVLVPAGDVTAFVAALQKVKQDYSQYNRIEISNAASAKYNYETVANKILDVYKEVIGAS